MNNPAPSPAALDVAAHCRRALAYPAALLAFVAVAWFFLAAGPGQEVILVLRELGMSQTANALAILWIVLSLVLSLVVTLFYFAFRKLAFSQSVEI